MDCFKARIPETLFQDLMYRPEEMAWLG